ncbi:MAG: protein kinase [Ardenticatenia bacterium]|nr:protein kinase [Ardenticatenia bacterium]
MPELARGSRIGPFPYRIVERLRQSKMSEVYLASLPNQHAGEPSTLVVLKIALRGMPDYLENEVERLRRLHHPGIVRLYPVAPSNVAYVARSSLPGDRWFFVMEHLAGGSLKELRRQRKAFDIGLALRIAQSLAETLAYLAENDQVHMDIKPDNVLFRRPLDEGGPPEPVLIDFGITRNAGQTGLEARSLPYCSPERIMAQKGTAPPETAARPHPSMDVYALGLILYQMVTGRTPFEGRSHQSLTTAILEGNPTEPRKYQPAVNAELNDLILAMIAREPGHRPVAAEVARRIKGLYSQYGVTEENPNSGAGTRQRKGRRLWPIVRTIILTVFLLAVLGQCGYWLYRSRAWEPVIQWVQTFMTAAVPPETRPPPTNDISSPTPWPALTPSPQQEPTTNPTLPTDVVVVPPKPALEPTSTDIPPATSTPVTTATRATTPGAAIATPESAQRVTLVAPANGVSGNSKQTFTWVPSFVIGPDEAFEVVFYRDGQDPFVDGFGLAAPVRQNSVTVDLDVVDRTPGHPLQAGRYQWGVRLYRDGQKVRFFGERTFTFSP